MLVLKKGQTNKFLPTFFICITNKTFSSDSGGLVSPVARPISASFEIQTVEGTEFPKDLTSGGWEGGLEGGTASETGRGSSRTCDLLSADVELPAESHFTSFYTCISAPHVLTNTRIRTMRLDRDNSHVTQIKAIQQVLAFQHRACQREYGR